MKCAWVGLSLCVPLLTGCLVSRPSLKPYEGTWLLRARNEEDPSKPAAALMSLEIHQRHHHLVGSLVRPQHFHENADGSFGEVSAELTIVPILGQRFGKSPFALKTGTKHAPEYVPVMFVPAGQPTGSDNLALAGFPGMVPPWMFERVATLPILHPVDDWPIQTTAP